MKVFLTKLSSSIAVAFALAAPAQADPIGGPDDPCTGDSCQGSTYTLTYSGTALPDTDLTRETFQVTLDIDTSTYSGTATFLDTVAIKVSNIVYAPTTLVSSPLLWGTSLLLNTGLNAGSCSGGGSGFICSFADVAVPVGSVGDDYQWVFNVTVANDALFTDAFESSIKARYVDSVGNKVEALVSEDITLQIPEPEIYAMMLAGLGIVSFVARRRGRRN